MPSTAPDQPTEPATPLAERIHANADQLATPAAQAQECQDTTSGIIDIGSIGGLGGVLSDRRLKRDILPVDWSR
ncbi:hypothetical protein ABT063_32790 [Streptomyces sp. NPDC002838]|uniref:hypothetical protein n=1 Tax=Streptomyces sp. NPDC002838 TaxID=3154436 RepID=UPI00332FF6B5